MRAHPVVLSVYSDHQNTGCDARPRMLAAKVACCCGADAEQTGTARGRARAGARTGGGRAGRTPWRGRPTLWESPVAPGTCGAKAWALANRMERTRMERIAVRRSQAGVNPDPKSSFLRCALAHRNSVLGFQTITLSEY